MFAFFCLVLSFFLVMEIGSEFNSILVSNSTFTGQMNHVLVSLESLDL